MLEDIKLYFRRYFIIKNIINAISEKNSFLILGHINPDEDCIASMSAIAIIIKKFNKEVTLYMSHEVHEHFSFLLNICSYNGIRVLIGKDSGITDNIEAVFICDTAKPSMVDHNEETGSYMENENIIKIEIDHHTGADSEVIGEKGYSLKQEASSASELVGMILLEINKNKKLLKKFDINDPMSRNVCLAILTGIIGDSKMGKYLKSKREIKYYNIFSKLYNELLVKETTRETNFSDMEQVFVEIQRFSAKEVACYDYIMSKKKFSESVGYVFLTEKDMAKLIKKYGIDIIVEMTRTAVDSLAEESKKIGMVVYIDDPEESDLIQFRMRRSKSYKSFDLREFLTILSIENGGGHQGAIGFRIPRDSVRNIKNYLDLIIEKIESNI